MQSGYEVDAIKLLRQSAEWKMKGGFIGNHFTLYRSPAEHLDSNRQQFTHSEKLINIHFDLKSSCLKRDTKAKVSTLQGRCSTMLREIRGQFLIFRTT